MTGTAGDHTRPACTAQQLQRQDPRKVGPYWLLGRLGGGGMGQVFLGRTPGGRLVAVKMVRAELAEQAEFRHRFAREVAAAQKVSGLFTAPVVDADPDAPVPWLATAYVPGPSLDEAITRNGPLPATSVLALAAGLAEGLAAIHAAGIVHRDLKPSNVLLAEDGPRIIDFGISRAAQASMLTGTGVVFGSPAFMSPEQAQGHQVGPPSDVFSLGAVLTFAGTGQGPFGTGPSVRVVYRVVFTPPDTEGLPADLRPLVERCLAKDPEQRPSTDQLLAELNTSPPAAGWLPAPITQAFPPYLPPQPGPTAPAAGAGPPATPQTQPAAVPRASVPTREMPPVTPAPMLSPAAAGTGAPGGSRGRGRPDYSRLGLASAAAAVALIVVYLIVAMTAHLPPFGKTSFAPSSPAPTTTAATSTGARPSPAVSSPPASPAATPPASPATTPPASPATTPPTTPATTPPTSPATTPPASPAATPPTTPPASPAATPPASPAATPPATPPASPAATPPATPPTTPAG